MVPSPFVAGRGYSAYMLAEAVGPNGWVVGLATAPRDDPARHRQGRKLTRNRSRPPVTAWAPASASGRGSPAAEREHRPRRGSQRGRVRRSTSQPAVVPGDLHRLGSVPCAQLGQDLRDAVADRAVGQPLPCRDLGGGQTLGTRGEDLALPTGER